jgi:hypothetical protein
VSEYFVKWYAKNGDELTPEQASALLVDPDYKIVEQTPIGPYWVSTVWLGLDHGFVPGLPPVIFETMVFATSESVEGLGPDMDSRRYCTEEQARAGHHEFVTLIRATLEEDIPADIPVDSEKPEKG